jgi:hypothetical protein
MEKTRIRDKHPGSATLPVYSNAFGIVAVFKSAKLAPPKFQLPNAKIVWHDEVFERMYFFRATGINLEKHIQYVPKQLKRT